MRPISIAEPSHNGPSGRSSERAKHHGAPRPICEDGLLRAPETPSKDCTSTRVELSAKGIRLAAAAPPDVEHPCAAALAADHLVEALRVGVGEGIDAAAAVGHSLTDSVSEVAHGTVDLVEDVASLTLHCTVLLSVLA
jgi:hypothetical protein